MLLIYYGQDIGEIYEKCKSEMKFDDSNKWNKKIIKINKDTKVINNEIVYKECDFVWIVLQYKSIVINSLLHEAISYSNVAQKIITIIFYNFLEDGLELKYFIEKYSANINIVLLTTKLSLITPGVQNSFITIRVPSKHTSHLYQNYLDTECFKLKELKNVRNILNGLLFNLFSPDDIIKAIIKHAKTSNLSDMNYKYELAAECSHRIALGNKPLYHLEWFVNNIFTEVVEVDRLKALHL